MRGAVQPRTALHVLVRPRGGDFLYSDTERQVLLQLGYLAFASTELSDPH